jgi:hypothetical protein
VLPSRRLPDAVLFRYTTSGVLAHTVVKGHEAIRAFRRAGWAVLIHSSDVYYADLDDVRQLDIVRFDDWKRSWEIGL